MVKGSVTRPAPPAPAPLLAGPPAPAYTLFGTVVDESVHSLSSPLLITDNEIIDAYCLGHSGERNNFWAIAGIHYKNWVIVDNFSLSYAYIYI